MPECITIDSRENPDLFKHHTEYDKTIDLWNKSEGLKKSYGKVEMDYRGETKSFGAEMLEHLGFQTLRKPYDPFFIADKGEHNRMRLRISELNRDLQKGSLGTFRKTMFTTKAVMDKYPNMRNFEIKLDEATNYERNHTVTYLNHMEKISEHMVDAMGKGSKGVMKRLTTITDQLQEAKNLGNHDLIKQRSDAMQELVTTEGGGAIRKLLNYMERGEMKDENGVKIDDSIIRTGKAMRELFVDMGGVAVNGLKQSINLTKLLYLGSSPKAQHFMTPEGKAFLAFEKNVNATIEEIVGANAKYKGKDALTSLLKSQDGETGYFPHYLITEVQKINDTMSGMVKKGVTSKEKLSLLGELTDLIGGIPETLRTLRPRRGDGLDVAWEQNPIGVAKRYAQEVIGFNKIVRIKSAYLSEVRRLKEVPGELAKDMAEYISDVYRTAMNGYTERPDMINKIVRVTTAAEFVSKLGFGIAPAARNLLTANYYMADIGYKAFFKAINSYRGGTELTNIVDRVEGEMGYKFKDVNLTAATEGLVPASGVTDVSFNPITESYTFNKNGKFETIDKTIASITGKSAIFQRVTENFMRQWMFRTSFINFYETMANSVEFTDKYSQPKIEKAAKRMALQAVNSHAFEYSPYAKAPIVGGTHKDFGAVGQVFGQFLHFPMSFANMQFQQLKGAKDAVLAGQWNAPEIKTSARYAGIYAMTALLGGILNLDIGHLMENDTVDRVNDMVKYFMADDEEERAAIFYGRGPVQSLYGGPFLSDLMFWGNLAGFYSMPDDEKFKIVAGYKDVYDMTDEEKFRRVMGTFNVQLSKMIVKDYPSLKNGKGASIFQHELGLYPRPNVTKIHEGLKSAAGISTPPTKKSKRPSIPQQNQPVAIQPEVGKALADLYKKMGVGS